MIYTKLSASEAYIEQELTTYRLPVFTTTDWLRQINSKLWVLHCCRVELSGVKLFVTWDIHGTQFSVCQDPLLARESISKEVHRAVVQRRKV